MLSLREFIYELRKWLRPTAIRSDLSPAIDSTGVILGWLSVVVRMVDILLLLLFVELLVGLVTI